MLQLDCNLCRCAGGFWIPWTMPWTTVVLWTHLQKQKEWFLSYVDSSVVIAGSDRFKQKSSGKLITNEFTWMPRLLLASPKYLQSVGHKILPVLFLKRVCEFFMRISGSDGHWKASPHWSEAVRTGSNNCFGSLIAQVKAKCNMLSSSHYSCFAFPLPWL